MKQQETMEKLKQGYQQVEVPARALAAIEAGIAQAKREQKQQVRQKWYGKGAVAAAALLAVCVVCNVHPQIAVAVEDIPVLNKVVQTIIFRQYRVEEQGYTATVQVPELQAQGDAQLQSSVGEINAEVAAYADLLIAQFQQEMAQQGGMYNLDVQYNVVTDNDNWFTLEVTTLETMASGAQSVRYYNLNKATGQYVQLADLFPQGADYVAAISDNIKVQMAQRMAEDENQIYFIDSDVPDDDFQQIAANQNFYYNQDGQLVIVFNEYEVAPGYMGCPAFVIDETVATALQ